MSDKITLKKPDEVDVTPSEVEALEVSSENPANWETYQLVDSRGRICTVRRNIITAEQTVTREEK